MLPPSNKVQHFLLHKNEDKSSAFAILCSYPRVYPTQSTFFSLASLVFVKYMFSVIAFLSFFFLLRKQYNSPPAKVNIFLSISCDQQVTYNEHKMSARRNVSGTMADVTFHGYCLNFSNPKKFLFSINHNQCNRFRDESVIKTENLFTEVQHVSTYLYRNCE